MFYIQHSDRLLCPQSPSFKISRKASSSYSLRLEPSNKQNKVKTRRKPLSTPASPSRSSREPQCTCMTPEQFNRLRQDPRYRPTCGMYAAAAAAAIDCRHRRCAAISLRCTYSRSAATATRLLPSPNGIINRPPRAAFVYASCCSALDFWPSLAVTLDSLSLSLSCLCAYWLYLPGGVQASWILFFSLVQRDFYVEGCSFGSPYL